MSRKHSNSGTTQVVQGMASQMEQMKKEGYQVFSSSVWGANSELYNQYGVLNFAPLSPSTQGIFNHGTDMDASAPKSCGPMPGGFTSSGSEIPVSGCGASGRGYIEWGLGNRLPNWIALANGMLPYTAAAIKFNVDTACGLGVRPMYRLYSGVAGQSAEVEIPYETAGDVLRQRIIAKQKEVMNLTSQRQNITSAATTSTPAPNAMAVLLNAVQNETDAQPEQPDTERYPHRNAGEDYYTSMSCDMLDEVIATIMAEIADLKKQLSVWRKTNRAVKTFLRRTNTSLLNHNLFNDFLTYGICFPEVRLTQNGSRNPSDAAWRPTIESIGWRNALTCRLERMDEEGVSRHIYLSNSWLDPIDRHSTDVMPDTHIDALPAINPMSPVDDLSRTLRTFRSLSARTEAETGKPLGIAARPCRHIMPIAYTTPGRAYYPQPSYWSIYNDIFQFACTIIRDRAIRKRNESMFGYIVYVHADYLDKLTSQLNAQNTDEERNRIKQAEMNKIKSFLANKQNNGQAFAACTFTGHDGKDHDAFRIEQVSMANKQAAEADKTEIADISSIILFALECHPDLIGSTPGGASSSGGTYQREMLQIKQSKLASSQALVLELYNLVRDFNAWDDRLCWHIVQRSLTTLDRSHSGTVDE